jgi:hypothetical protein
MATVYWGKQRKRKIEEKEPPPGWMLMIVYITALSLTLYCTTPFRQLDTQSKYQSHLNLIYHELPPVSDETTATANRAPSLPSKPSISCPETFRHPWTVALVSFRETTPE